MVAATLREVREPGTGKTETRRILYSDRVAKKGTIPASASVLMPYLPDSDLLFGHYWALTGWHLRKPGDRLWIRENWKPHSIYVAVKPRDIPESRIFYSADGQYAPNTPWRPSIHMPRWASRLTLIVESVKIERLQEVDEATALREGIECRCHRDFWAGGCRGTSALECFKAVWWSLHGIGSWNENPWVVAVRYRPILANIDAPEAKAA